MTSWAHTVIILRLEMPCLENSP